MKATWYENELYKELGITLTHNAVGIWYLTLDLWWVYLEIQFNKEKS